MAKHEFRPWFYWAIVAFVFGTAAFLRLIHLGSIPAGITWDEAALGYIGRMIILTRRDEWGQFLPLVFQSFGDYKAPLAFYIVGTFTTLFGLSAWVVRLPFALAGIASVVGIGWITWLTTKNRWLSVLAGWLLAVMPWSVMFSRVGFESNFALLGFEMMLVAFLLVRDREIRKSKRIGAWVFGAIGLVLALYSYHSFKVILPLTGVIFVVYEFLTNRAFWRARLRELAFVLVGGGVLVAPMAWSIVKLGALTRASQTTIVAPNASPFSLLVTFLQNFFLHLSPQFLLWGDTTTLRHGTGSWGVLLWAPYLLLIISFFFAAHDLFFHAADSRSFAVKIKSWLWSSTVPLKNPLWLWWALIAATIAPAAIGFEVPHANRALVAVVPMILAIVAALERVRHAFAEHKLTSHFLVGGFLLATLLESSAFWRFYTTDYVRLSGADWLSGYQEVVQRLLPDWERGQKIKFTNEYGQPEIFFAFVGKLDPTLYRYQRIRDVAFGPVSSFDRDRFDIIVSGEEDLAVPGIKPQIITRPDGSAAFHIYYVH